MVPCASQGLCLHLDVDQLMQVMKTRNPVILLSLVGFDEVLERMADDNLGG